MYVNNCGHEILKGVFWGGVLGILSVLVIEPILLTQGYDAMAAIIAIGCFIGSMLAGGCIGPIAAPLVASVREYLDKQQTINAEEGFNNL